MKKAISFLSLLLMAIIAFAEPHFVSLSNKGGKTTAIFTLTSDDKDRNNGLGIENIMLECNNGKTYKAKHVDAQFGDTTTVIVKFKKLSKLENSRLKFCINGEDKYIDIPTDMN